MDCPCKLSNIGFCKIPLSGSQLHNIKDAVLRYTTFIREIKSSYMFPLSKEAVIRPYLLENVKIKAYSRRQTYNHKICGRNLAAADKCSCL